MIYGHNALQLIELEEELFIQQELAQTALNEMYFSKKDLQDPKTIEKIVKKKEQHESISSFVAILFMLICLIGPIVAGIATGSGIIFVLAESIWLIFSKVFELLSSFPANLYDKNMEKYRKKVEKLRDQTEKRLKSNPKNADDCRKIIDNCDKVLKELDRLEKRSADKKYKEKIKEYTEEYQLLISMLEGKTKNLFPVSPYWPTTHGIAVALGVKEKSLIDGCIKSTKPGLLYDNGNSADEWEHIEPWFTSEDDLRRSNGKSNDRKWDSVYLDKFYPFILDTGGDWIYVIHQKTNKVYLVDESGQIYPINSVYSNTMAEKPDMKILEDVDASLGYYRIAKCPPEVKKKKFPV